MQHYTNAFAKSLDVPANRIATILNGQRGITADTALRLAQFFGSTPDFWMSLQSSYDAKKARESVGSEVKKNVKPSPGLVATLSRLRERGGGRERVS